jgi:hypothetical protein
MLPLRACHRFFRVRHYFPASILAMDLELSHLERGMAK